MDEKELYERLHAICDRLHTVPQRTLLGFASRYSPPFDISKPNKHDSKAEFLAEVDVLERLSENVEGLLATLRGAFKDDHPQHQAVRAVKNAVDAHAEEKSSQRTIEHPVDLAVDNAARVGATATTVFLLFEWREALAKWKQELKLQEKEFWSGHGRAPNHYARIIALRLAKEVAQ